MKPLLALIACVALLLSAAGARQASETYEPPQHRFPHARRLERRNRLSGHAGAAARPGSTSCETTSFP